MDDTTLDVTELPVRKWTQDYKEFLEGLIKPEEKAGPAVLADYREHHSDADVHFSLQLLPGQLEPCLAAGLHAKFKLQSKISCGAQTPPVMHYCPLLLLRLRWLCCLPAGIHVAACKRTVLIMLKRQKVEQGISVRGSYTPSGVV